MADTAMAQSSPHVVRCQAERNLFVYVVLEGTKNAWLKSIASGARRTQCRRRGIEMVELFLSIAHRPVSASR